MRTDESLSLGIELGDREIRLVQARIRHGEPFVADALAVPVPSGIVEDGVVLDARALATVLRRALDGLESPAPSSATIAVPGKRLTFGTVTVPPSPDPELPALVASEIEIQGLFDPRNRYGFFPILPAGVGPGDMRSLAVVGAEASAVRSLAEVAEAAGLGVAAIEPGPLAMIRAATRSLAPEASAFVLAIDASLSLAAYFVAGRLAAFRRLDSGTDALGAGGELDDDEVADRLATEAGRTMDYVQRADRAAAIDRVRIVCDDPAAESLAAMLERRFGMPVEIVLPDGIADGRFSVAYGLAIRGARSGVSSPSVDLFVAGRTEARRAEAKRYVLGSAFVGALAIGVGLAGALLYNGGIDGARRRAAATGARVVTARAEAATIAGERTAKGARERLLRKEGIPLGPIMDYVARGVDPGAGLKSISIGDDLKVHLSGEARDETALVRTAGAIKACPALYDVAVERFERDETVAKGTNSFTIMGRTLTDDRVLSTAVGR